MLSAFNKISNSGGKTNFANKNSGILATITEYFDRFQFFNPEKSFLKRKAFIKKLEYSFLVGSATFENGTFPYKSA